MQRMRRLRSTLAAILLSPLALAGPASTQESPIDSAAPAGGGALDWGADLVSRYVWRGLAIGTQPNLQPYLSYSRGPFTLGTWGSYAIDGGYLEQDLWAAYSHATPAGSLIATVYDYYTYVDGEAGDWFDYFDYRGVRDGVAEGQHTLELILQYAGPESVPVSLLVSGLVHNDPDHSLYAEAGYSRDLLGLSWGAFGGMTLNRTDYYGAEAGEVINLGLSATRMVALSPRYSVALSGSAIRNPVAEQTLWVLRLGL